MGSYTVGTAPVTLKRGRPFASAMSWRTPEGSPIDITGFTFAAAVKWNAGANAAPATVSVDDAAAGAFTVRVEAADTLAVPVGQIAHLALTIYDAAGGDHDLEQPILCVQP